LSILLFLAGFVKNRAEAVRRIERLRTGYAGLLDSRNREIFAGAFNYLAGQPRSSEEIYDDILRAVLNVPVQAALHVENLRGADGEIALRLGDGPPFGL